MLWSMDGPGKVSGKLCFVANISEQENFVKLTKFKVAPAPKITQDIIDFRGTIDDCIIFFIIKL
jgi:hypothetical protein